MIGHLYTLLFTGSAPAPNPPRIGGTSGVFPQYQRKTRKAWEWLEKPKKVVKPALPQAERQTFNGLTAALIAAQNAEALARIRLETAERLAAEVITQAKASAERKRVEAERIEAEAALALAVEQERQAQQAMVDFDIAFVASVLANA